ncbi:ubiquinone/menaquinone biosynthesis C-methylase UbiE [Kibdelosporangium banguiense]|uniref:Ubiquinone/menaquinone biosynthesis C-methylase UbiE n=1 Tax=Kibdelosporangium banguiense TaxID=1365924 RepID=A0ABS4TF24_9PSEU|nr:class I SAM-dependent methyltransferase [Kibdelosporangium banguiense]MBP2322685.1 ubiquinone/menaquinone biosynthesis C-methylase UbiE [Kibdelosporangium banguiense]
MSVFDDIAGGYDDNLFHLLVAEKLVIGVADAPSPGLVLDVATGTGAAAFAALQHLGAHQVVAIDLSARMIDRAKAKAVVQDPSGKITWHVGPAVPAPVQAASTDLVVCASSLHFLGAAALKDWLRVLRPEGRLAFSLPLATTFNPSPAFASYVAADVPLPASVDEAAAIAEAAGYEQIVAHKLEIPGERVVFLVYATAPS